MYNLAYCLPLLLEIKTRTPSCSSGINLLFNCCSVCIHDLEDYEAIEDLCTKHGLNYVSLDDQFAVGLAPWKMEEHETYAQFKQRVQKAVEAAFNVDDCGWIEEAGYDG